MFYITDSPFAYLSMFLFSGFYSLLLVLLLLFSFSFLIVFFTLFYYIHKHSIYIYLMSKGHACV